LSALYYIIFKYKFPICYNYTAAEKLVKVKVLCTQFTSISYLQLQEKEERTKGKHIW